MNMRTIGIAVIVVALVAAFTGIVSAVPDGANVTIDVNKSTMTTAATGTDAAEGGYITGINLTSEQSTAKWQGYFGNITGSIVLADSNDDKMYDWGEVTNVSGEVFATTRTSAPVWADANSVTTTERDNGTYGINALWGWSDTADDADATFNDATGSVTVAGLAEITGTVATTVGAILPAVSNWQTLVITDVASIDAKEDYIFVGPIQNSTEGYRGSSVDYQIIVPENIETGSQNTYYFYVEIP